MWLQVSPGTDYWNEIWLFQFPTPPVLENEAPIKGGFEGLGRFQQETHVLIGICTWFQGLGQASEKVS